MKTRYNINIKDKEKKDSFPQNCAIFIWIVLESVFVNIVDEFKKLDEEIITLIKSDEIDRGFPQHMTWLDE